MDRWVILNSEGKIINIVVWNGDLSTWQPPENATAVLEKDIDIFSYEWQNDAE
jgi:hypothetical protein